jgi:hypothetical protein
MAQFRKDTQDFIASNKTVFDVGMLATKDGEIITSDNPLPVSSSATSPYNEDAYGRPKTILDRSLFSATFTHAIVGRVWEEGLSEAGTPSFLAGFTNATSRKGMLSLVSGTTANNASLLRTKRHFRYQANRGQLFSTSANCPNPTASGNRLWGLTTRNDGFAFELTGDGADWDLEIVHRAYGSELHRQSIKSALLEKQPDFDPSMHQLYDIQIDKFARYFVNTQLIYTDEHQDELEFMAIEDESLPVVFRSTCLEEDTEVELLIGSVDVTTEGGYAEPRKVFGSINTGLSFVQIDNTSSETAMLAIRVPRTITYDGRTVLQTRGVQLNKLVTWIRDEARTAVYYFRDTNAPNLSGLTWNAVPDSVAVQTLNGGDASALHTAFVADKANGLLVMAEWSDLEVKNVMTNPSIETAGFVATPGDIIVIAGAAIGNNKEANVTLYYAEEI